MAFLCVLFASAALTSLFPRELLSFATLLIIRSSSCASHWFMNGYVTLTNGNNTEADEA